jgi:O-acetyl-ADP-ribose deacetylase (regulator of RNase III)
MEIKHYDGDVLTSTAEVIAHQTNCMGVMGAGIALQIAKKYPEVEKAYKQHCAGMRIMRNSIYGAGIIPTTNAPFGTTFLCKTDDGKFIANVFGQHSIGRGRRMTDYEALYNALDDLLRQMEQAGMKTLALPYLMSCGIAGGDWEIVSAIISSVFRDTDITIEIWHYNK